MISDEIRNNGMKIKREKEMNNRGNLPNTRISRLWNNLLHSAITEEILNQTGQKHQNKYK